VTLPRTRRIAIVLVAVAAAGCGGGHKQAYRDVVGKGPMPPAPVRRNGLIAFVREGSLYGIRPDGTGRRRLLDGGPYYEMAWSPDGSRVALDTTFAIVVRRSDGSDTRTILHANPRFVDGTVFLNPAWSPDGKVLAIDEVKGSVGLASYTVELMRLDGRLHAVASHSGLASWGPDGRLYYDRLGRLSPFETTGPTYDALHVLDWKGDRELARAVSLPAVSPDGRRVAYVADDGVMLLDLASMSRRLLLAASRGYEYGRPSWSPDGRALVVQRHDKTAAALDEIWVVRATGAGARRIVAASDSVRPAWLPR
jgi:Tol biopolymer transport system component